MKLTRVHGLKLAGAVATSAALLAAGATAADAITLRQGTSSTRPTASSPAMASGASTIYGTVKTYLYPDRSSSSSCDGAGSMSMKVGTNPATSIQLTLQTLAAGCGLTLRTPVVGTLTLPTSTAVRGDLIFPGIELVDDTAGTPCVVTPTFDPPASGTLKGSFWNQNYINSPTIPTYSTGVRLRSATNAACSSKWGSLYLSLTASPLRSVGPPRGGTIFDGPFVGVFG